MKVTILGFRKAQTKNGRGFVQYYFKKDFSDYDLNNSECNGELVGSEFSYKDYNLKVGDVCDFQYEPGFNERATLSDVIVLKDAVKEQLKEHGKA